MTEELKQKKEEMVSIKKVELDEILQRLNRVEFAADKGHLARFDDKNSEEKGKYINLRSIDGKIILSWSDMNTNIVEKNANGAWYEDQSTTITFEDGTKTELTYAIFSRRYAQVSAKVIEETLKNGELLFGVVLEDGREIKINSKFVN